MASLDELFFRISAFSVFMLPLAGIMWGVLRFVNRVVTGPTSQLRYPQGSFLKACCVTSAALLAGYGVASALSPAVAEAGGGDPSAAAGAYLTGFGTFLASLMVLLRVWLPTSLLHALVLTLLFFISLIAFQTLLMMGCWWIVL